ncbi:DNA methyltransferase [Candidatus Kaiserbacteria bacterium CG10_big_fil_rev_8_21_14_0_10_51_14]|uniref:DNA methyltransferase n=1 Tax=Candidatus Kaiserbacteria bacterium CG10_big_fil_rev_8_21_14_0_10_51_14 TaxID=1974610 RepID=A0A2H0UDA0_9BACT|nr:MAG: DNA methyltransferase [Candidatus Kaiserbacteria bacterium CG10_big_fil_rev_8_21_14_0_10_51_14]
MTLFEERPKTHKAAKKSFSERVVALAVSIPPGRVSTYGAIARAAGGGGMAAQSITSILSKAWDKGEHTIPFHRIVYSDGRIWISDAYRKKRMALYKKERIQIDTNDRIINFRDKLYEF